MKVEVHSSTLKLVPSDVVWWFMSKAVQLGVMAGGAAVKWCDGDTSKREEWEQLADLRYGLRTGRLRERDGLMAREKQKDIFSGF